MNRLGPAQYVAFHHAIDYAILDLTPGPAYGRLTHAPVGRWTLTDALRHRSRRVAQDPAAVLVVVARVPGAGTRLVWQDVTGRPVSVLRASIPRDVRAA